MTHSWSMCDLLILQCAQFNVHDISITQLHLNTTSDRSKHIYNIFKLEFSPISCSTKSSRSILGFIYPVLGGVGGWGGDTR